MGEQTIDIAVDRNGHRYTIHCFANPSDPWYGATILLPSTVARLKREGLLPLAVSTSTEPEAVLGHTNETGETK